MKIGTTEYSLQAYIAAPELVGLNIYQLFLFITQLQGLIDSNDGAAKDPAKEAETNGKLLQLIIDNMGELTKLAERIIIKPKLVRPKMSFIIQCIQNPEFMAAFTNTFDGLVEMKTEMEAETKN